MVRLWELLATLLSHYGAYGAGLASVHGMCEKAVPVQLQKQTKRVF